MKRTLLGLLFCVVAGASSAEEAAPTLECAVVPKAPAALGDASWAQAAALELKLQKQAFVPPMGGGAVAGLSVRCVRDGERLSFLLRWSDATLSETIDLSDKFVDACALQLPLDPAQQPTFMMGHQGARVNIWRWRALRQGPDRYPKNYADDFYREAALPNRIPGFLASFEQLVAEGFGTLTRCKEQILGGEAKWEKGQWSVVISRSLKSEEGATLAGGTTQVAFAVWDGQAKERNGMKSITQWIGLNLK